MARNGSSGGDDGRDGARSSRSNPQGPQDSGSGRRGTRVRMTSSQISTALREAQQLQQENRLTQAIQICEELEESGVDRADVHYFLGWLYQEASRWPDAAAQFERLLDDPEYALSCYYALGQCARAMDNIQDAAHYFDEAVDRVNLDILTIEESDQLIQLCQEAAEAHRDMSDAEGAETIYSALLGFLRSQNWQEQIAEVERLMHETLGVAPQQPRRRRAATGGARAGENIPQRGGGRGRGRAADALAAAADGSGAGLASPSGQDAAMAQPGMVNGMNGISQGMMGGAPLMPPMAPMPTMPMAPDMITPGFGQYPGQGMMGIDGHPTMTPPVGGGMAALVGGAPISSPIYGTPGAGNDRLAQLINNLSGPAAGMRAGLTALPDALRGQVAQAMREIENYVAHGLLTAAVEECLRVMEIAPQYLDVHLLLGEIYVRQGKIEQAIAKYAILVDTYLVNGRLDDAIATYRRILQLEPNNLNYRIKLIDLLLKQGNTEEALVERMAAADSYLRMGYADRAIQEYEQALLAHPNNTQVRLNYAAALMKGGRAAQAVGEYQRILQVDQGNTQALARWQIALATGVGTTLGSSTPGAGSVAASRVAALETLGRLIRALRAENFRSYDEIVREYTQALEMNSGSAELRYSLGQVHLAATRQQEALTCFQQMTTAPGWEVFARFAAGQAYLLTGDPANAALAARELEEASAAVRRSPPEPTLWSARPRGETEERLGPEVEVGSLLARAYQLSGQVAQMQATMQSISQQRPANDEIYQLMAEVSARQGDPQAALQEYAQLARHYRSNRQIENAVTILKEM
ncbi:MAG TPA: tetratricopeptide repeat protein, partial [Ktedonobacterales bacterium]|nr:tetratricopeptide repeat protein [Ktedonobacterales bacterium]